MAELSDGVGKENPEGATGKNCDYLFVCVCSGKLSGRECSPEENIRESLSS